MAVVHYHLGDVDQSRFYLEKASAINPDYNLARKKLTMLDEEG